MTVFVPGVLNGVFFFGDGKIISNNIIRGLMKLDVLLEYMTDFCFTNN